MPMIKNFFIVLVVFVAGFITNKIITTSISVEKPALCENLNAAKNDLISISQNEYLEYTKIKDLKQKYEKADELLGKVMLLFLADIGFKAAKMPINDVEVKSLDPESVNRKTEATKIAESAPTTAQAVPEPQASISDSLKGKSQLIRNLNSQAQINEALDKALIENPKVAVAGGNPVEQQQMKVIEGSFVGEIKFFDKKREARNVSWELIPNYRENLY